MTFPDIHSNHVQVVHNLDTYLAPATLLCLFEREGRSEFPSHLASFRPTATQHPTNPESNPSQPTAMPIPSKSPAASAPEDSSNRTGAKRDAPTACERETSGHPGSESNPGLSPAGQTCTGPVPLPDFKREMFVGGQASGCQQEAACLGGEEQRQRFVSVHEWLGAVSCGLGELWGCATDMSWLLQPPGCVIGIAYSVFLGSIQTLMLHN